MKRMLIYILLLVITPMSISGQSHKRKPKVSFSKGTFFGYYGYNRAWYGNSTLNLTGPGYQIALKRAAATDNPFSLDPGRQLNPLKATAGQYNFRLGYYIKNHYSISFGFDKLKYVLKDGDQVLLTGQVNQGVDSVNYWNGSYTNEPVQIDHKTFMYSNSGLNYLRVEFTRADQWFAAGSRQQIILSSLAGIGAGALISDNSFLFAGKQEQKIRSFSGFAASVHLGVRLEFFKHVFIQSNFSGGWMGQSHVRTRANDPSSFADQNFGYLQFDTNVGFLLYIRPTNNCNTCPVW
jgi:hypothetical protein